MSPNRYAPPSSSVADIESLPESLQRPRNVTLGVRLLWAEIAIGIPGLIYQGFTPPKADADDDMFWGYVFALIMTSVFTGLGMFLNYKAWKGRNWARIVILVLLIVGLVMSVAGYAISYVFLNQVPDPWPLWESAVFLLQTLLDIVAMLLLFTPSANAWYRAIRITRIGNHE